MPLVRNRDWRGSGQPRDVREASSTTDTGRTLRRRRGVVKEGVGENRARLTSSKFGARDKM